MSDSDRTFTRNIYPDAVTRYMMRLIDPTSDQLGPSHRCYFLEESQGENALTQDWVLSLFVNRFQNA